MIIAILTVFAIKHIHWKYFCFQRTTAGSSLIQSYHQNKQMKTQQVRKVVKEGTEKERENMSASSKVVYRQRHPGEIIPSVD